MVGKATPHALEQKQIGKESVYHSCDGRLNSFLSRQLFRDGRKSEAEECDDVGGWRGRGVYEGRGYGSKPLGKTVQDSSCQKVNEKKGKRCCRLVVCEWSDD